MTIRAPSSRRQPRRAFTLLEVVVAVGIFGVGMVAVLALFTPVARSISFSSDAEAAARVADALRTRLQTTPLADVEALLKTTIGTTHALTVADGRSDYNPAADAQILFASRDGSKIGVYTDAAVWGPRTPQRNPDQEKFFEIALIRNEAISPLAPPADDGSPGPGTAATAFMLAYTARVRWPAFVKDGATGAVQVGGNPTGTVRFDHSMKQSLFFTGAVTR